ncbi:MAG: hypothetical protein JOS17DRAFT_302112 [Linnemannia elongata]|nr:MAG: hypothetical protein JOS17DRAFT_302112 [Linnemannia elongata]
MVPSWLNFFLFLSFHCTVLFKRLSFSLPSLSSLSLFPLSLSLFFLFSSFLFLFFFRPSSQSSITLYLFIHNSYSLLLSLFSHSNRFLIHRSYFSHFSPISPAPFTPSRHSLLLPPSSFLLPPSSPPLHPPYSPPQPSLSPPTLTPHSHCHSPFLHPSSSAPRFCWSSLSSPSL